MLGIICRIESGIMYNDDKTINVNLIIDIQGEDEVRNRERKIEKYFRIFISIFSYDSLPCVSLL